MALPVPQDFDETHEVATSQGPDRRRVMDRRNHMSLVEFRHTLQLSNIPASCVEPLAYLYGEWLDERFRFTVNDARYMMFLEAHAPYLIPVQSDPDEENLKSVVNWITQFFIMGQSAHGWKGDLMTSGMKAGHDEAPRPPGGKVAANAEGKTETREVRRGVLN